MISLHEKRPPQVVPTKILQRSEDSLIYTKLRTNISCPARVRLLILVSSNLGNSDRRTLIRNSWGPDNSLQDRWRTVFLLTENDNQKDRARAEIESQLYGDIITGDYQEAFFNMAFKVAMGFEWALKFCKFDYLLKTDDDIFVNTHGLLEYLDINGTLKEKLYTGNPMWGSPVLREGRYAVKHASAGEQRDDATNKTMFEPYCSGGGFLLSNDVVSSILNMYDLEHPLNIDDAYIGELAHRAGVSPLKNTKNFLMYADGCKYNPEAFVQHPAKGHCLEELHRQHVKYLLTGELETPKPTTPPTKPPTTPQSNFIVELPGQNLTDDANVTGNQKLVTPEKVPVNISNPNSTTLRNQNLEKAKIPGQTPTPVAKDLPKKNMKTEKNPSQNPSPVKAVHTQTLSKSPAPKIPATVLQNSDLGSRATIISGKSPTPVTVKFPTFEQSKIPELVPPGQKPTPNSSTQLPNQKRQT